MHIMRVITLKSSDNVFRVPSFDSVCFLLLECLPWFKCDHAFWFKLITTVSIKVFHNF